MRKPKKPVVASTARITFAIRLTKQIRGYDSYMDITKVYQISESQLDSDANSRAGIR